MEQKIKTMSQAVSDSLYCFPRKKEAVAKKREVVKRYELESCHRFGFVPLRLANPFVHVTPQLV